MNRFLRPCKVIVKLFTGYTIVPSSSAHLFPTVGGLSCGSQLLWHLAFDKQLVIPNLTPFLEQFMGNLREELYLITSVH